MSYLHRLRIKWGVSSMYQVIVIMLVFAITGFTIIFLKDVYFKLLGFDQNTPVWIKTFIYLLLVFPSYQLLILGYGALFGQFDFFWSKEKKMMKRIADIFRKKSEK
ncbi:MAG: hypothetical protein JJU28_21860 [Cyclobacteriaceae bacterium]|nr:hypothetical protein [Cyclobacteriaceae bacterium]